MSAAAKDHTEVTVTGDFMVPKSLINPAFEASSSYPPAPPVGYPTQTATKHAPPLASYLAPPAGYPVSTVSISNVSYNIPITATTPPTSTFSSYYTPTASVLDASHYTPVCYPSSSYPPVSPHGYAAPYDPMVMAIPYPLPAAGLTPAYPPSTAYPHFEANSASNSSVSYGLVPSYPSSHYNGSPFQAAYPPRSLE